ncbi:MAG: hypothetical protein ACRDK3_06685 [Actinomycetota bacterium]
MNERSGIRLAGSMQRTESSSAALAVGARVAGLVISLGYLTGLVGGPLVAAVGGLALVTFGRSLAMERWDQAIAAGGLAVIAGSVGITGLRWGTLELAELRSVQAVLGPTLMVGPEPAAAAVIAAAAAAMVALALWIAALPTRGLLGWTWTGLETLAAALALASAFWGPKVVAPSGGARGSEVAGSVAVWVLATGAVMVASIGGSLLARNLGRYLRAGLMLLCLAALPLAAALIGGWG